MIRHFHCSVLFLLVSLSLAAMVVGEEVADSTYQHNWPHWRGPLANGVAPHANPPIAWGPDSNIKWKVALPGRGTASPIVWNDRVYILTAIETDREGERPETPDTRDPDSPKLNPFQIEPPTHFQQFTVMCLDRSTGDLLWKKIAREAVPHEGYHHDHGYASGSPTTDGQYLYASFGSHGIYCYDMDGELKWERDLGDMRTRFSFGEACTPVLHDGMLIVMWDQEEQSMIYALDAATGETLWEQPRDEPSNWSTPLVVEHAGKTQVVTNGTNRVRSYDLNSGELLWECGGQTMNAIPSPVSHQGLVYCMSNRGGNAVYALPLDASGDITDTDTIVWHRDKGAPYVPSPLLYGDRLYMTSSNRAILSCLDSKTGEPLMDQTRLQDVKAFYASPVAAADRLYLVGRDGTCLVVANSTDLEVLATNELDDPIDATPALAGSELFLRSQGHLYCIEEN